jgi:phospholipid/cholesterol/gamma-HCH transport system substrate-binding protein
MGPADAGGGFASGRARHPRSLALVLLVVLLAVGGCDIRTAGAPKGAMTLTVVFDDAQHLVPGHAVKVADVQIGTVISVELEGYRARVTMSIADGRSIPEGTRASLSQTSLLGENYVRLEYPDGYDPATDPAMTDGEEFPSGGSDPTLEQVTSDALDVLGAIEGGDLARIVEALSTGVAGRGDELHTMIEQLQRVGATFASQRDDLAAAIDGLAALGRSLAADDGATITRLTDDLAAAARTLAEQRARFVDTLTRVDELAQVLNDDVLIPHGAALDQILSEADDVTTTLAANRDTIAGLLHNLSILSDRAPHAFDDVGGILIYGWITALLLPDGSQVPLAQTSALTLLAPPGATG